MLKHTRTTHCARRLCRLSARVIALADDIPEEMRITRVLFVLVAIPGDPLTPLPLRTARRRARHFHAYSHVCL